MKKNGVDGGEPGLPPPPAELSENGGAKVKIDSLNFEHFHKDIPRTLQLAELD